MRVDQVVAGLRELLIDTSVEIGEPVFALSSWLIRLTHHEFHITVEYAPALGLLGLSSQGGFDGAEEIYRELAELADRVRTLVTRRCPCEPGTISTAAYAWSKQEAERLTAGTPQWAEHAAVVQSFESRPRVCASARSATKG